MFTSTTAGWRVATSLAFATVLWSIWTPAPARIAAGHRGADAPSPQPTVDARVMVAALPSVLTPPLVDAGVRLVAMVAEDIDRDGDLDVVANDGTVALMVWTNDGTGRLTRQSGRPMTGWRTDTPGPGLAARPVASALLVQSSPPSLHLAARVGRRHLARSALPGDPPRDAWRPPFVSLWIARGPPASLQQI